MRALYLQEVNHVSGGFTPSQGLIPPMTMICGPCFPNTKLDLDAIMGRSRGLDNPLWEVVGEPFEVRRSDKPRS